MSSDVISITVEQSTDLSNITRLAWLLIMIKQILNTFIRDVPININARYYHMMWHLKQITGTHGFWWRKKTGFKENFSVMMDGAITMLGTNVGFTELLWIETGVHILCAKESARQRHEIECCVMNITNIFIAHSALNTQEGWKFFGKSESKYGDLLPHSEVCWISKGKILSRFIVCIDEIQIFWPKLEKLIYCSIMKPDRYNCGC